MQHRKVIGEGDRPLSARSVIASTLLGVHPPRVPGRLLVRAGELFGISEGTTRVALSRMVAAGDLRADNGDYELVGPLLLERQARQSASRHPAGAPAGRAEQRPWSGRWFLAVVHAERRDAPTRAALRDAARKLRLAQLREGVWARPDNLDPERLAEARAVVTRQCHTFRGEPGADDAALAASLWDLDAWAATAEEHRAAMAGLAGGLDAGETTVLAPAFTRSAAVLRHLLADPLLPGELLPASWPGRALREDYDRYDAAFNRAWRAFTRGAALTRGAAPPVGPP